MRIAFSGACHSGKTTLIKKIKALDNDFVVLDEIIRDYNIDIDDVRSRPGEYLELQIKIITKKIQQERECVLFNKVLIDRSIFDSTYYLNKYLDVNKLNNRQKILLNFLNNKIFAHYEKVNNIYDYIALLEPIKVSEEDKFRPKDLELIQREEYELIKELVESNFNKSKIINRDEVQKLVTSI